MQKLFRTLSDTLKGRQEVGLPCQKAVLTEQRQKVITAQGNRELSVTELSTTQSVGNCVWNNCV